MDFDMPDDWFDDPVRYLDQEYEVQLGMITELVKGNMKGLTFAQIRLEETLRYLDNTVRIADKDRERKIEALIKEREIFLEADHRAKLLAT